MIGGQDLAWEGAACGPKSCRWIEDRHEELLPGVEGRPELGEVELDVPHLGKRAHLRERLHGGPQGPCGLGHELDETGGPRGIVLNAWREGAVALKADELGEPLRISAHVICEVNNGERKPSAHPIWPEPQRELSGCENFVLGVALPDSEIWPVFHELARLCVR